MVDLLSPSALLADEPLLEIRRKEECLCLSFGHRDPYDRSGLHDPAPERLVQ